MPPDDTWDETEVVLSRTNQLMGHWVIGTWYGVHLLVGWPKPLRMLADGTTEEWSDGKWSAIWPALPQPDVIQELPDGTA